MNQRPLIDDNAVNLHVEEEGEVLDEDLEVHFEAGYFYHVPL